MTTFVLDGIKKVNLIRQTIPYQSNEKAFFIRKLRANFDARSIDEHPHRHEFTEFIYIKNGSGKQEIDGVEYDLISHTFYIISKGQVHHFLYAKNLEGILIRFQDTILPAVQSSNEGFYYNLLFSLRQYNEVPIPSKKRQLVDVLLGSMLEEYEVQTTKMLDLSLIQHLLYPLIILLNRCTLAKVELPDYTQDLYAEFINLLEQAFKQQHNLSFYARTMGLSSRKLTEICHVQSGKSAKKIITERLMTEAQRLLKYTSLPLKEIVAQLGYKDIGYFCRYFKKTTGMTPSVFKEK